MPIDLKGKTYRNMQEQVLKNAEDIEDLQEYNVTFKESYDDFKDDVDDFMESTTEELSKHLYLKTIVFIDNLYSCFIKFNYYSRNDNEPVSFNDFIEELKDSYDDLNHNGRPFFVESNSLCWLVKNGENKLYYVRFIRVTSKTIMTVEGDEIDGNGSIGKAINDFASQDISTYPRDFACIKIY